MSETQNTADEKVRGARKVREGLVVSDKMYKTVVVLGSCIGAHVAYLAHASPSVPGACRIPSSRSRTTV